MITLLEIPLVLLIGSAVIFYLTCAAFTYQFFTDQFFQSATSHDRLVNDRLAKNRTAKDLDAPVSILVPVCGLDAGAWDNWSSFCLQHYPQYEVLFGVTDPQDPAIPMLEKIVATYADRARLFYGLKPRGINYKDSNLSYLLEEARHEVIIFADSDIRVHADYIRTVTAPLADETVGLVTCAFIGYHPRSVGAAIASFGRCFDFIPSLLIARILDQGLRCAVGATIATRKATLASFGGLHFNRIGSDYNLGKRAAQSGYRIELSRYVLESDTGHETIGQVFQRELRWARTIRFNRGAQYYSMVFCYGTVYCLPLLLLSEFANWAIALSLTTLIIRYAQVLLAILSMRCPRLLLWLWVLPLRDALNFAVWLMGAFGQGVYWRGRQLRVEGDGLITQWE